MRTLPGRALMGLFVACCFFAGVEMVLRLVYGTPENVRFHRPHWLGAGRFFAFSGDMASAAYQGVDTIGAFPAAPTEGKARMVGFGESSMRGGSGLPPEREFLGLIASELERQGRPVEALNLARSGMDSNVVPRLVYEAIALKPDIAVFYFGHNDIANSTLERRYGDVGGALEARAMVLLERTQLFTQLQRRVSDRPWSRPAAPDATLTLTPEQARVAEANFERNLRRAVGILQDAGTDAVLITPASPLDTWFASAPVCPEALPADAWGAWRSGYKLQLNRIGPDDVERAHATAPDCPEVAYLWGLLLLRRGQRAEGWAQLALARDHDPAPMRATSGIVDAVREVARDTDAGLVDFEAALRERDSLSGLFTDNVHLNVETHALLARLAAPVVSERLEAREGR